MEVKRITVIGAGATGSSIAQVGLMAGFAVAMHDIQQSYVERGVQAIEASLAKFASKDKLTQDQTAAMPSRLLTTTDIKAADADAKLMIEAVFKDLSLKQRTSAFSFYSSHHRALSRSSRQRHLDPSAISQQS